eukprot:554805-Rhodomonas_salina.1
MSGCPSCPSCIAVPLSQSTKAETPAADGCCWCGTAGEKATMGRGGMSSKIAGARVAGLGGIQTVISSGYDLNNITNVFSPPSLQQHHQ